MSNIRLHPKFGVNPSMDICFYCQEPKGVVLMGYNQGKEAPRQVITDYQPCDACAEKFKQGFLMIECSSRPNNPQQPPIQPRVYPTGSYWVITLDAAQRAFPDYFAGKEFPEDHHYIALLEPDAAIKLGLKE